MSDCDRYGHEWVDVGEDSPETLSIIPRGDDGVPYERCYHCDAEQPQ